MAWVASMAVDVAVVPDGRDAQMMSENPVYVLCPFVGDDCSTVVLIDARTGAPPIRRGLDFPRLGKGSGRFHVHVHVAQLEPHRTSVFKVANQTWTSIDLTSMPSQSLGPQNRLQEGVVANHHDVDARQRSSHTPHPSSHCASPAILFTDKN